MNNAGSLGGFPPAVDGPRTGFFGTRREIRLETQGVKTNTRKLVQPAFFLTHGRQKLCGLIGVEVDEFALHFGVKEHCFCRSHQGRKLRAALWIPQGALIDVEDIQEWLSSQ